MISCKAVCIHCQVNKNTIIYTRYKIRPVNATQARKAMQTATRGVLSGAELTLVEDYLAHSANIAERFYRLKTPDNVCKAKQLMDRLRM